MDIPVTAGPELVLGVVLGILLALVVALAVAALRRRAPGGDVRAAPPPGPAEDDLPGFLESPPGFPRAPGGPAAGWAALAAPPAPPADEDPPSRPAGGRTLTALALAALLLVGAAAAVAAAGYDGREPRPAARASAERAPAAVAARLVFGGVVLERHAVGVTVAYPTVRVTTNGGRAAAEVDLVTWNCLRADAPEDPAAAGCTRTADEHAELSAPSLDVDAGAAGLRLSGRFATERRPNGSPPEATGRAYHLTVRAAPLGGRAAAGTVPATGVLELGDDRARTRDDAPSEITYRGR